MALVLETFALRFIERLPGNDCNLLQVQVSGSQTTLTIKQQIKCAHFGVNTPLNIASSLLISYSCPDDILCYRQNGVLPPW